MSNRAPRLGGVSARTVAKGEVTAVSGAGQEPAAHFPALERDIAVTAAASLFLELLEESRVAARVVAARVRSVCTRLAHARAGVAATFTLVDVGTLFRAGRMLERRGPDEPDGFPADARLELRLIARSLARHVCGFRVGDLSAALMVFAAAADVWKSVDAAPGAQACGSRHGDDDECGACYELAQAQPVVQADGHRGDDGEPWGRDGVQYRGDV